MERTVKQSPLVMDGGPLLETPEGSRAFMIGFVDAGDNCQVRIGEDFIVQMPFEIRRAVYETVARLMVSQEPQT